MKVCGVSFGKNIVKFDYPFKEAILSILPICDEIIVAVGDSEDNSLELIESIAPEKLRIVETIWDESLREGGRVLADETNKALAEVPKEYDWIFYIQGDEVIHEKYLPIVMEAMLRYKDDEEVDGLLFKYKHFYGSYQFIADSFNWYKREIRVIKNRRDIYSYKDAQGFRKKGNKKLNVKPIDAYIYHYGWVKDPIIQQEKQKSFHRLWHEGDELSKRVDDKVLVFDYSDIDSLLPFKEDHPAVMKNRVVNQDWEFEFNPSDLKLTTKNRFKKAIKNVLGVQIGEYKNYTVI
jgi:hypothetical protein